MSTYSNYSELARRASINNNNNNGPQRQQKKRVGGGTANPLATLSLSKALEKFPHFFDEVKISVVQKSVARIDRLPRKYCGIETLFLSNNNLQDLDGISQFQQLRTLTLAHNELADVKVLRQIQQLSQLECLNLQHNPISKHPNYKIFLLTALPRLRVLDGKGVTDDARLACEVKAKQQTQMLQTMLRNYCQIICLNSFNRRVDIHCEMMTRSSNALRTKFMRNLEGKHNLPSYLTFKESFDYLGSLADHTKQEFSDLLLNDILELYLEAQQHSPPSSEEETYHHSFEEMLKQQSMKLAQLHVILDKKMSVYHQTIEELRPRPSVSSRSVSPLQTSHRSDDRKHGGGGQSTLSISKSNRSTSSKLQFKPAATSTTTNQKGKAQQKKQNALSPQSLSKSQGVSRARGAVAAADDERDLYTKMNESFNPSTSTQQGLPISKSDLFTTSHRAATTAAAVVAGISPRGLAQKRRQQQQLQQEQEERDVLLGQSMNAGRNTEPFGQQDSIESVLYNRSISYPNIRSDQRHLDHLMENEQIVRRTPVRTARESKENSPLRNVPTPSAYEQKSVMSQSHHEECCSRMMRSQMLQQQQQMGGSMSPLSNRGNPTPYKRRNKELEDMVFNLSKQLEQKMEEVEVIKGVNSTIKDKLVEVHAAKESTIRSHLSEQADRMKEAEFKENVLNRLESELASMRQELTNLMIRNHELSNAQRDRDSISCMYEDAQTSLSIAQANLRLIEQADAFRSAQMKKRWLQIWRDSAIAEKAVVGFLKSHAKETLSGVMSALRRYVLLKKFSRVQREENAVSVQAKMFLRWRSNAKFSQKLQRIQTRRNGAVLAERFLGWKQFVGLKERASAEKKRLIELRAQAMKVKCFIALKENRVASKLSEKELEKLSVRAKTFHASKIRRIAFNSLRNAWNQVKLKQAKIAAAEKLWRRHAMQKVVDGLVQNRKESHVLAVRRNKVLAARKKQFVRRIFAYLVGPFVQQARDKANRNMLCDLFIKKRLLAKWKRSFADAEHARVQTSEAIKLRSMQVLRKYFNRLVGAKDRSRVVQLLARAVKTKREVGLQRSILLNWRSKFLSHRAARLESDQIQRESMREYFARWTYMVRASLDAKKRWRLALSIAARKRNHVVRSIFSAWAYRTRQTARNETVLANLLLRKQQAMKRLVVSVLGREQSLGMHRKLVSLQQKQALLSAEYKAHESALQSTEDDNHQIAVKSRELIEQNIQLQQHITAQNQEMHRLKRDIQVLEKQVSGQEEVISELEMKNEEQVQVYEEKLRNAMDVVSTEEQKNSSQKSDIKQLNRDIETLHSTVNERGNELASLEKFYRAKTAELINANEDLSTKLANSVNMANEFRATIVGLEDVVGEKENAIISLNERVSAQAYSINECMNVIQRFESTVDTNVAEYEEFIAEMESAAAESAIVQSAQAEKLAAYEQEIRKLMFEINLLREEREADTSQFISSLVNNQTNSQMNSSLARLGQKPTRLFSASKNDAVTADYWKTSSQQQQQSQQLLVNLPAENFIRKNSDSILFKSPAQSNNIQNTTRGNESTVTARKSTTTKEYKILQHQFERQRTQLKDQVRVLNAQIRGGIELQPRSTSNHAQFIGGPTTTTATAAGMYSAVSSQGMAQYPTFKPATVRNREEIEADQRRILALAIAQKESMLNSTSSYSNNNNNNMNSGSVKVTPRPSRNRGNSTLSNATNGQAAVITGNRNNQVNMVEQMMNIGSSNSDVMFRTEGNNAQSNSLMNKFVMAGQAIPAVVDLQSVNGEKELSRVHTGASSKSSTHELSLLNNPADNLLSEIERNKSERNLRKNAIEMRIKSINENLSADILNSKANL